jgi:hypothetical protein
MEMRTSDIYDDGKGDLDDGKGVLTRSKSMSFLSVDRSKNWNLHFRRTHTFVVER